MKKILLTLMAIMTVCVIANAQKIFIGYPIWWNEAPRIINTFIESLDLKGKIIVPFATSGGSGITNSVNVLKKTYPDLKWEEGRLLNRASREAIQEWVDSLINKKTITPSPSTCRMVVNPDYIMTT